MIENRKTYRIPFRTKFVFAHDDQVFTGNTINISAGGLFVSCLESLPRESLCRVLFLLEEGVDPICTEAIVKRVSTSTFDPEDAPGLGFQFENEENEMVRQQIDAFMEDSRKNYEVASTILSSGEPDLASLSQFLKRMHLPSFQDLGELKLYIERVIRSIELVETPKVR
jgi:hypothetical protein